MRYDWEEHYIRIFADQDMFMWYTHLGVGHAAMLWKISKDCLAMPAVHTDAMEAVNCSGQEGLDHGEVGDCDASDDGGESDKDCEEELDDDLSDGEGEGSENEFGDKVKVKIEDELDFTF
ncbi:hypothetical protein BDR04DRAFT_1157523 [Suillus decipiens]|nr:hypothetical protein BDR04DRAFT_1157523 [Suillus decipiens]